MVERGMCMPDTQSQGNLQCLSFPAERTLDPVAAAPIPEGARDRLSVGAVEAAHRLTLCSSRTDLVLVYWQPEGCNIKGGIIVWGILLCADVTLKRIE